MDEQPTNAPESQLPTGKPSKSPGKVMLLWLFVFFVAVLLWQTFTARPHQVEIPYNQFLELIDEGQIEDLTIQERRIYGILKRPIDSRSDFELVLPFEPDAAFAGELVAAGIIVHGEQYEDRPMMAIFLTWGPVLLIVSLWVYFMRFYVRQQSST